MEPTPPLRFLWRVVPATASVIQACHASSGGWARLILVVKRLVAKVRQPQPKSLPNRLWRACPEPFGLAQDGLQEKASDHMTTEIQKKETFFERHSWKWFILIAVIFGLFGIGDVILGMDADPAIAESITGVAWPELQASSHRIANLIDLYVRVVGMHLIILSIITVAITLVGFRQGEKWAWYVL